MRPKVITGVVAALAALALFQTGTAAGGYEVIGPVVARGISPAGVPWQIRAHRDRLPRTDYATFAFTYEPPGCSDAGYFSGLALPIDRRFLLHAGAGSDLSPADEADVSGIADRRVRRLDAALSDGSVISVHLYRAPDHARKRLPWVRGLRTFDQFFDGDLSVQALIAYDAAGARLGRTTPATGLTLYEAR